MLYRRHQTENENQLLILDLTAFIFNYFDAFPTRNKHTFQTMTNSEVHKLTQETLAPMLTN